MLPNTAPDERRDAARRAPDLRKSAGAMVGVGAFLGSLRGLKLVPAKWRYLVPGERRDGAQSRPAGSSLSRSPVPLKGHTLYRVLRKREPLGRQELTAWESPHENKELP